MTKKSLTTMAAKDELDMDSFLRRHNSSSTPSATAASSASSSSSSDDDVDDLVGVHRTVDDILNDSDTSDEDDVVTARYSSSQSVISRSRLSNSEQLKYNYDDAVSSLEELKVARLETSLIGRDASEVNLSSNALKSTELKYSLIGRDASEVNLSSNALKSTELKYSLIGRDANEVNLSSNALKFTELKYSLIGERFKTNDHDTNDASEVNLSSKAFKSPELKYKLIGERYKSGDHDRNASSVAFSERISSQALASSSKLSKFDDDYGRNVSSGVVSERIRSQTLTSSSKLSKFDDDYDGDGSGGDALERVSSETLTESSKMSESRQLKYNLIQRLKSDGFSSRRPPAAVNSRPMSVFGSGVRSAGKPGAAFAAATAASRPIKSRRAMSLSLVGKVSDGDDLYDSPGRISSVSGDVDVSSKSVVDDKDNVAKNVGESSEGSDELLVTETESVSRNHESFVLDSNVVTENEVEESHTSVLEDIERDNDTEKSVVSEFEDLETNKVVEESVKEKSGIMEFEDIGMSNEVGESGNEKFDSEHFEAEKETERAELPNVDMNLAVLDEVGTGRDDDDSSSVSGDVRDLVDELLEDKSEQLESEGAIRAKKKPLELAEEVERKQASSGHDWEEGAAAQPMRLDGVVRGSSVLGYFDVSADNVISRAIKSQEFRRDYGSPQVLAVHLNYIALGMTKGVIVVVPSKYSVQHGDSMESKRLMLGAQGDRSHVPVTSMCFNQLGDLLLAGYGDGHVTLWTLPRGTVGKVITGEHKAPVVHAFFLGQDSQITRQCKAVTGDCKGVSKIHEISLTVFGFQIKTKCVFDGETTGTVLCASPLLPDELTGAASSTVPGNTTGSTSSLSGVMGGVIGGATGWKLFTEDSSLSEEAVVVFVSNLKALVVRLSPSVVVYKSLLKPEGVRKGALPYTAWKCTTQLHGSSAETSNHEALEKISLLALAWDCKVRVFKLVKKDLEVCGQWTLESAAIGVAWLDDQLLVILTLAGQLCLYTRDGTLIHQTSYDINGNRGDDMIVYHTYFTNYPERAYQNSLAVRGACVYVLAPTHLVVSRLLLWKERIQVLRNAGDWMGAFNMAMTLYDGQTHGVIDLPRNLHAIQEALMPYLVELLFSYVDEVFSYISVACSNHMEKEEQVDGAINGSNSAYSEIKEQFTRVGGVAVEFCIHIKRTDILFDDIFSKFVAVQHRDTFLELLEPYILKDMLGSLPPEIMQALVEHYNFKGWLQRVEQCVLHMDISSLDFNQVVRLCRENGLYGALIYLFNKGLDDFKTPLEELLSVLKNHERDVAVVGYRMLVYLKYCFSGLAFPPGHGTIPSQRLSSLRTELVQLLLEDSGGPKPQTSASLTSTGAYLNLYYLLELDTEASLDVLRIAFTEDVKFEALNSLLHSSDAAIVNNKENDSTPEDNNLMVQKTVDSLALVLDVNISQTAASDGIYDTSIETWPSKNDIGHLIEFIACFIASKRAIVSKSVLSQILEFLISENYLSNSEQMNESKKVREKKVLALLDAVPQTEWNASYVLHLCEKAQFYQVCGLIHTSRCNYLAALDSYMKDMEEPVHTFSFIDGLLLKLSEAEANAFRSAVISRIPELVILNREWTFFLTSNHFNKENGLVLSELRTSSRSLFLYLKTLVEAHSSGTINFSKVSVDDVLDGPWGRQKKDEKSCLETFLERVSGFPKIIHDNPLEVTDDMIELYLEMLCQNEPDAVLKFLETCENYRVDRCLQLCQEYRIVDAAAFLLERVGDVGSALLLILSDLNSKFTMLDTAVGRMVADMGESKNDVVDYTLHASRLTEVQDIKGILHACISLCQRNSSRLESGETESLWFHLLDTFCEPFLKSQGNSENGVFAQSSSFKNGPERDATTWKVCGAGRYALVVKKLFSQFVKEIVEGMIGFVRLPSIMSKLLSDNGGQEFGDFKPTILGMLGTYGFEMRILDTAKCLIEDDAFYTMSALRKGASKGYAPRSLLCSICNCSFSKSPSSSGIRMFNCGHATHLQCELQESGTSSQSSSSGCPICVIKKKSRKAKGKAVEQGLVSTSSHRSWRTQGTTALQPHEFDALEHSAGSHPISRFEMLSSLQNKKVVQADTMPQLRLAPPAVYHEKVNKRNQYSAGGSSGSQQSKIRQLQDLKVKGSSNRFQLKSKIFGKEKTRVK